MMGWTRNWTGLLLGIALILTLGPGATAGEKAPVKGVADFGMPDWFKVSFLDLPADARAAAESDKHLLLFWYQEGCPYCAQLINANFSQKRIAAYTREHFDVVALNLWGNRRLTGLDGTTLSEKSLGEAMDVQFTPTLLFVDGSGEVVQRLDGYYPPRRFLAALRYVAEGYTGQESLAAYLQEHVEPRSKGKGEGLLDEPFFAGPPHDLSAPERPLAVLFEQDECPDCRSLHEEILREERARQRLEPFRVVQLDRWGSQEVVTPGGDRLTAEAWADRLDVEYVPALVLFDEGKEVIRMESLLRGFHVRSMLAYVASGAYKDEPRFQRYLQQRNERLREQGITVDLWETE